jgi:hypothetical protein
MHEHTYTTLRTRSAPRSRLILPASVAELRAALEARVAKAPDDIAARVSLGELNLSLSLAATARADQHEKQTADAAQQATDTRPELLRVRHVVPNLAATRRA